MVNIDLNRIRDNKSKENQVDMKSLDPLELQRMKLAEAQWRALGTGGSQDEDDPIDREVAKSMRDLRMQSTMRQLRGGFDSDDNGGSTRRVRELEEDLRDAQREIDRLRAEKLQAEQDAKWQAQFGELRASIANLGNNSKKSDEPDGPTQKLLDQMEEMRKARETDREEARKYRDDQEKKDFDRQMKDMQDTLQDNYDDLARMIEANRGNTDDQGIVAYAKRVAEEANAMDMIAKSRGYVRPGDGRAPEEKVTADDVIKSITDNAQGISHTVRSITDDWKNRGKEENLVPDIGPRERQRDFNPKLNTATAREPTFAETYVAKGNDITNHPEFPGRPVFVGPYGDYYTDEKTGEPLDKNAVMLKARTDAGEMEPNIKAAEAQYREFQRKEREKSTAPEAQEPSAQEAPQEKPEDKSEGDEKA